MLGHAECTHVLLPKYWLHSFVWFEVLLVLGVLQLLLLDVGPQPLHHLGPRQLLVFLGPDQSGELWAQFQRFGETASFWHFVCIMRLLYSVYRVPVYSKVYSAVLASCYIVAGIAR